LLLANALAERGFRVAIVSFDVPGGLPDRIGQVRVVVQPRPKTKVSFLQPLARARLTATTLAGLDVDLVVQRAAGTVTGLVGTVTRLRGGRFVYSSANVIDFSYEQLEPKWLNVKLYELGVRLASTIVVQTQEQAVLCRRRFGRDAAVIKSLAEPAEPSVADSEAFLWIGRLTHYKRPEAFVALARAVPEASFRMVVVPYGEEGQRIDTQLRAEAAQLGNLEVLDPRPRPELMDLVNHSIAIVNTAEYEGMPNIFLEGWSRGVPALALSHDPDGVIVRHGLGGFGDGDPDAFAQLARHLWASRADREDIARRCLGYIAAEHAPSVIAERWASVLGL
jgi:glycosyltransferase involved in cell wall biosynthesis